MKNAGKRGFSHMAVNDTGYKRCVEICVHSRFASVIGFRFESLI